MKKFFLIMVASVAIFASCKSSKKSLDIMLDWTPNTNHTGLYAALKLGYFLSEGLDVKIIEPSEESTSLLVAAGKVPFGISFQDTMSYALGGENPLEITAVAAIISHNTNGIISLASKNIKSPRDLMGLTYSTWMTPIETATLKKLVTDDGGDFERVNILPTSVYDCVSGLSTGEADAMSVYYAWDGVATKVKGLDTNFLAFKDIDPTQDYYSPVIIANNKYLKSHGDEAKRFLRAVKKGYIFAIENPDEAAKILCELNPELDRTLVTKSQAWLSKRYCDGDVNNWGRFDKERWTRYYKWLSDSGLVNIKSDAGFTNDYLE